MVPKRIATVTHCLIFYWIFPIDICLWEPVFKKKSQILWKGTALCKYFQNDNSILAIYCIFFRAFTFIAGIIYTVIYILDIVLLDDKGPGQRSHFLLYQACLSPSSLMSARTSSYYTFHELLIVTFGLTNIFCNIYLYRFLELQRSKMGKIDVVFRSGL